MASQSLTSKKMMKKRVGSNDSVLGSRPTIREPPVSVSKRGNHDWVKRPHVGVVTHEFGNPPARTLKNEESRVG